jgi:hypothetical protein
MAFLSLSLGLGFSVSVLFWNGIVLLRNMSEYFCLLIKEKEKE